MTNSSDDSLLTVRSKRSGRLSSELLAAVRQVAPFVRGAAAARLAKGVDVSKGGIPVAASDHTPIEIDVNIGDKEIKLISWNLLSDAHLYNNFRNIEGIRTFQDKLSEAGKDSNYYTSRLNIFFYELAEFARKEQSFSGDKNFIYSPELLEEFASSSYVFSLPRGVSLEEIKRDRGELVDWFRDLPFAGPGVELCVKDFEMSVLRSLQMLHIIESGGARWNERKKLIKDEAYDQMCRALDGEGYICLQECTSPLDIIRELRARGGDKYEMLVHNTGTQSDNCVIIYNKELNQLEESRSFALGRNKPAILARFRNRDGKGQEVVIGSIHYPGGDHHEMDTIHENILQIRREEATPVILAGDLNHGSEFFNEKDLKGLRAFTVQAGGTTAAPDFGNKFMPVDGAIISEHMKPAIRVVNNFVHYPRSSRTEELGIKVDSLSIATLHPPMNIEKIISRGVRYEPQTGALHTKKGGFDEGPSRV